MIKKTDQQNKEWFENVLYLPPHPQPPANTLIPVVGTKHEMATRYTYAREEERRKETRELSKKLASWFTLTCKKQPLNSAP